MLKSLGLKNLDGLFADIRPGQRPKSFDLPEGLSEWEVSQQLRKLAAKNRGDFIPFISVCLRMSVSFCSASEWMKLNATLSA